MGAFFFDGIQVPLTPVPFTPTYEAQQPRALVKIDGNPYIPQSYRITFNAHGATDEATIIFPIGGNANVPAYPDWTRSIERSAQLGNADVPVSVEIWAGFPGNPDAQPSSASLTKRFTGVITNYVVDHETNIATMTCGSVALPLTTTKITTPFTAEATMTTLAFIVQVTGRFGIAFASPQVVGAPGTMLDVLGSEYVTGIREWYIWDLILQCAQFDDVDVWVDRTGTLHYAAASLVERTTVPYTWGKDVRMLSGTHAPQFSKNVEVQVHSWTKKNRTANVTRVKTNPNGGTTVTQYSRQVTSTPVFGTTEVLETSTSTTGTATSSLSSTIGGGANANTGTSNAGADSGKQKYVFFVKNKTHAQCGTIAQAIWRQISMHEYAITLTAPVTIATLPSMDVTALLEISGSPMTYFNSQYWPRQIEEEFDPKSAWQWVISAVNHTLAQGAV